MKISKFLASEEESSCFSLFATSTPTNHIGGESHIMGEKRFSPSLFFCQFFSDYVVRKTERVLKIPLGVKEESLCCFSLRVRND